MISDIKIKLGKLSFKKIGLFETSNALRLRGGGLSNFPDSENDNNEELVKKEIQERMTNNFKCFQFKSLFPNWLRRQIISWKIFDNQFSIRILFVQFDINFIHEGNQNRTVNEVSEFPQVLRLRGGSDQSKNISCGHDIKQNILELFENTSNTKVLRLRGGGPIEYTHKDRPKAKNPLPNPADLCKDLMADFEKVMTDYKKALGPCGTGTCPLNYNVLEDQCKKVCQVTCPQPYCPPKLDRCSQPYCPPKFGPCEKPICPHLPDYSNAEEDENEDKEPFNFEEYKACYENCFQPKPDGTPAVPCGRSVCPFSKKDVNLCPTWECPQHDDCNQDTCVTSEPTEPCMLKDPMKDQIKCNKHICPYKKDQLTVDDTNPFYRKIKSRKGCGSPFCPHSNKYQIEPEVIMPAFPCKKPCPSIEDLPPIHWDCPDPLPKGECTNPFCPFREKLPCGHCPIDARHCGMPGCQFAGDSLCPPTCPYTQKKPPKDIECTPSVCPLVRPPGYKPIGIVPRKEKPCGDICPYAKGIKKKTCGNPDCPYRTCIDDDGEGGTKKSDCGNPMCPYQMTAKKRAEKEQLRAKNAEELEGLFVPVSDSKQTSRANTSTDIGGNPGEPQVSLLLPQKDGSGGKIGAKSDLGLSKSGKMSTHGILKLMQTSMHQIKDIGINEDPADPNVCRQISCAQFLGDRLCKKCQQKQREAEAAGTDLKTMIAKKDQSSKKKAKKQNKKKKHRGYVYDKGTYYPGVRFGHKDCKHQAHRVPWDMGWRWNIHQPYTQLKQRAGWRPGAIGKTMLKFINAERKKLGLPPRPMIRNALPRRRFSKTDSDVDIMAKLKRSRAKLSKTHLCKPKPTLTIKKKDGIVYVTMNPLKDPSTMDDNEYPYIDCSPLEFKITKKKDDEFKKCLCTGDDPDGVELSQESSELDIEFTPPAGLVRPEVMERNKHICHTESQYDKNDLPKSDDGKKDKKGKRGKKDKGKKGGKKGGKKSKK